MRTLLLTRGSAGVGKSTFIEKNNLKQYTLCADDIRLLFQSPVLNEDGQEAISQKNDKKVWEFLFKLLEERMKRGEFTVIDATHSTQKSINAYRELAQKYRYRVFVIDFTSISIGLAKERNLKRPRYKQVPEEAIDNMYARFATQKTPTWVTTIHPYEFQSDESIRFSALNFTKEYDKIHVIGDIHGCYDVLNKYFELNGGMPDNELFIFVGDYCDRGIQNVEVLKMLISIVNRKNVIFLEGNHEIHLWKWANGEKTSSEEFETRTKIQLEEAGIDKKEVRQFYRKIRQCAYFIYNDRLFLVTHGGLSSLPSNLTYVATEQMIKGVGVYATPIDEIFTENTESFIYQIHGHRNIQEYPIQVTDRTFNLEGKVEFGGELRAVQFTKNGDDGVNVHCVAIPNEVYNVDRFKENENVKPVEVDNHTFLKQLRESTLVQEKELGDNISSFNFKPQVFFDKLWDKSPETLKARGLFINTATTEIVGRSYNKFFNINERDEVRIENLNKVLKFPVKAYVKENGYLGILGYDSETDKLVIASKSTTQGDYAEWFKNLFNSTIYNNFGHGQMDEKERELKDYLKEHNCTFTFEVIDIEHDPHIIEYKKSKLVLLDIVYRTPNYSKADYIEVLRVGELFGFEVKQFYAEICNWSSFLRFYNIFSEKLDESDPLEGFVFEDANGFMIKLKTPYYNFWKYMRSIKDKIAKPNTIINQSALTTPLANEFVYWLKQLDDETLKQDIITLRKMFYEQRG